MIISHSHKFIFTKPRKVAGTSIEVALSQFCGPDDIITSNVSSEAIDADSYTDYARNDSGYFNHMRPSRIRAKIGKAVWNNYFVFTIVRNPWDMLVSRYFWNKKGATPQKTVVEVLREIAQHPTHIDLYGKLFFAIARTVRGKQLKPEDDFATFIQKLPHNISNTKYYFDWRGRRWNNYVIRYEHLDEDYKTVCEKIGIPYTPLPSLKTKTRSSRDYRSFYTPALRDWVAKKFHKEITEFGYSFDPEHTTHTTPAL